MEIKFTVPGNPKGKQRPIVCRINGQSVTFTPRQTIEYEKLVRASYEAVSNVIFPTGMTLEITIIAFFISQNTSKKSEKFNAGG